MNSLVRTLLIWLLVLVVPAQGAVAATIAFCGPNHHGGGAARAEVMAAPSEHAQHGHGASAHEAAAVAPIDAPTEQASAAAKQPGQAGQKCQACAFCCSLGALLTSVPVVPATETAPTVFDTIVPTVDAFAADGPDRPPRHVGV